MYTIWVYDLSIANQKMGSVTFSPILLQNGDDPYPSKSIITIADTTQPVRLFTTVIEKRKQEICYPLPFSKIAMYIYRVTEYITASTISDIEVIL